MKKIIYSLFVFIAVSSLISCNSTAKKETTTKKEVIKKEVIAEKFAFVLQDANNAINWTAYKTTKKAPVNGIFKKVTITANGKGNTVKEAINNVEFSIPVSSVFTKESSRDFKIKKFFFGIMDNTKLLSGKLVLENDTTGYADITMNGVTKKLAFTYTINGKVFSLTGNLKITNWNAAKALASLNEACKDLHKGDDGVSKTWDDVAINITSTFK
ncbi:YceI family protein [Tenacibaculum finnmarkense]|uniref:YceI family protein n=1 Tax=Tenacibaculum finnmarkense TaxID=2781243 RepID=UPI001EFA9367|nr:YceI family protein [Tenacibaculum finnmarkense]MCG8795270.1 YceI family protein [Tenacibaculum finnmarkense]MCG8797597.1 YceI family protein [Tenacibaculum finnmarkense]MCG8881624.1 YceI family protein [Tenacibaculum finnmarkense]